MSELTEFLLTRIAEDEEAAYHAQGLLGMVTPWHRVAVLRERGLTRADAQHVERWSAARVLAECDAKRRIVEHHTRYRGDDDFPLCSICTEVGPDAQDWPCLTLRALALPHADHPDYDEQWRP